MSRVLLASWGDPSNWRRVTYIYDNGVKGRRYTFSSTLALAEILGIKYCNTVIFLATSLFTKSKFDINNNNKDIIDYFDYIKGKVREYVLEQINNKHGNVNPDLVVVPSIGYFKNNDINFVFKGSAETYLTSIYYHILGILQKRNNNSNNNGKEVEIHLDTTHGVNYMPLMCKEAVELAANTYAVITGKRVRVIIYNSDPIYPIPRDDDPDTKLNINKTYEITYNGYKSLEELLLKFALDYNINKNFYTNNLARYINFKNELEEIEKLSKAVSAGILLLLPYYKDKLIKYKAELEKQLADSSRRCELKEEDGKIVIEHAVSSYRIALLHSVLTTLVSIRLDICKEDWIGISLRSLKENLRYYYEGTLDSVYSIVSAELDKLKGMSDELTNDYKLYGVIKYGDKFDKSKEGKSDRRTLYAHGGLEENVTFLKKADNDDNNILISYGNYLNEVFNQI